MLFHTMVKSKGFSDVQSGPEGKWSQIAFGQHHTIALDEQGKVGSHIAAIPFYSYHNYPIWDECQTQ